MFGLNIGIINDYSYLRQQHFHSGLLADASCSLLGLIKETNCTPNVTPLFLLHSTPRLAVALKIRFKMWTSFYDRV